ncbi:MAG: AraC family transcriptional regulator [Acidobacteriota bacterium]
MRSEFIRLLDRLAPDEGFNRTPLDDVMLYRTETPIQGAIFMYDPCVVFVAQRRKIGYVGGQTFVYDPGHYLVLPALLPFKCDADGSPEEPFLALSIPLKYDTLAGLISRMDEPPRPESPQPLVIYSEAITDDLIDAAFRLVKCLQSPAEAGILGPQRIREILFRVLQGSGAGLLFDIFSGDSRRVRIARTLRHIHENYQSKMDVPSLARREGMSVSSLHDQFKKMTSQSPLQYIKSIRLNRARELITFEGLTNSAAAHRVGYESVSQFSREFKRYFGYTPKASKWNFPIPREPER